ncbi:hypothetical protein AAMO2058_001451000 [Amorphochlora amoebiformis]
MTDGKKRAGSMELGGDSVRLSELKRPPLRPSSSHPNMAQNIWEMQRKDHTRPPPPHPSDDDVFEMHLMGSTPSYRRLRTEEKLQQEFEEAPQEEALSLLPRISWSADPVAMCYGLLPALRLLGTYNVDFAKSDLVAGVTIAVFVIPQGMAYALLAGIPVQYGLYTSITPSVVYTLLGTSRHMHIGPFALISLMVGDAIESLGVDKEDPEASAQVAITMSFVVGILLAIMALCRLGFIVSFLSDPVLEGFTVGASILICTSQIKHILGLDIPRGSFAETIAQIFTQIHESNPAAVITSVICIGMLVSVKMYSQRRNLSIPIPIELIVVVLSTLLSAILNLKAEYGLPVVGEIPPGLPPPQVPDFSLISDLFLPSLTITVVLFVVCASIVKTFSMKHGYETDENQELLALSLANIIGSFWLCYPACGSLSRSAVVSNIGAKSQLYNIFVAVILVVTLLTFAPLLATLPNAVLGSVILVAFRTLIVKLKSLRTLWIVKKADFFCWLATFLATIFMGTSYGLLIGFMVSILILLQHTALGQIAELANLPGTAIYRNVKLFPGARRLPRVAIVRFGSSINFVNRRSYREQLANFLTKTPPITTLALDMSMANAVDVSGINMLRAVTKMFREHEVQIMLVGCRGPVRAFFQRCKFSDVVGMDRWFVDVPSAIDYLHTQPGGLELELQEVKLEGDNRKSAVGKSSIAASRHPRRPSRDSKQQLE